MAHYPGDTRTSRYVDPVETAKMLRVALKEGFPGVRFSVRTNQYAGGASIDVRWSGGPAQEEVEKVADHFAGATFDGMTDSMDYHATLHGAELLRFGADFVFCRREREEA